MFTYIDPTVRERLIAAGQLKRIDANGALLDASSTPDDSRIAINVMGPIPLPVVVRKKRVMFDWYAAVRHTELRRVESLAHELTEQGAPRLFATLTTSMAVNSVLVSRDPAPDDNCLVRVHSSCLTGDVFGSARCECGPQLDAALEKIHTDAAGGALVYMAGHEGRGIGLWAKAATYLLQDAGENTYEANESLGLPADSRDYTDAAALLAYLIGQRPFRLMTNNPKKIDDLAGAGLGPITPVAHVVGIGDDNRRYVAAKRERGHRIDTDDLEL
ncbi:MAG: GTP cyclohydrolase II RibA [Pseudomonadota bacterium]